MLTDLPFALTVCLCPAPPHSSPQYQAVPVTTVSSVTRFSFSPPVPALLPARPTVLFDIRSPSTYRERPIPASPPPPKHPLLEEAERLNRELITRLRHSFEALPAPAPGSRFGAAGWRPSGRLGGDGSSGGRRAPGGLVVRGWVARVWGNAWCKFA